MQLILEVLDSYISIHHSSDIYRDVDYFECRLIREKHDAVPQNITHYWFNRMFKFTSYNASKLSMTVIMWGESSAVQVYIIECIKAQHDWCHVRGIQRCSSLHHGMHQSSAWLLSCEGNPALDSPHMTTVMLSFDAFYDVNLNMRLNQVSCR